MDHLTKVPYWPLFLLLAVLLACSAWCIYRMGGPRYTLDTVVNAGCVRELVGGFSKTQRDSHILLTSVFDSLIPATYGFLLLVFAAKSRVPTLVLLLPLFAVVCDYLENLIQLRALHGEFGLVWLKSIATPGKFLGLVGCVALIVGMRIQRNIVRSE
jgi:hypothetical protein